LLPGRFDSTHSTSSHSSVMKLTKLFLKNFLAIGEASVDLVDRGIVHVVGVNRDDPSATSNGAGKSSLVSDGLLFTLFGKTMKGQVGAEVVNRFGDGPMQATVEFYVDDDLAWRVERGRENDRAYLLLQHGGKDETLGSIPLTQKKIEQIVGVDAETFAASVIFGQGRMKSFTDMTDSEQKEVFSKLLGLDEIDQWRTLASDRIRANRSQYSETASRIETVETLLTQVRDSADSLRRMQKEWAQVHHEKLSRLQSELSTLRRGKASAAADYQERVLHLGVKSLRVAKRFRKARAAHDAWLSDLVKTRKEHDTAKMERARRGAVLAEARRVLRKFEAATSATSSCPSCRQPVDPQHRVKVLADLIAVVEEASRQEASAAAEARKRRIAEEKSERRDVKLLRRVDRLEELFEKTGRELDEGRNSHKVQRGHVISTMGRLQADLKAARNETFKADTTLQSMQKSIPKMERELEEKKDLLRRLDSRLPYLQFWEAAFGNKGLKSFILDSVAPFLTKRANLYSEILTGGNIEIEFQTVNTLKGGAQRDSFKVLAVNRNGAAEYGGASEGERDKIKLCAGLAMQDLVRSRSKLKVNVAVFDEASKYVDQAGLERFIELLDSNLVKAETVFVIAHAPMFTGHFTNEITVVKEGGVSHVQDG
jgi:DNA repair exonuclease SbcCD ATPase subunit